MTKDNENINKNDQEEVIEPEVIELDQVQDEDDIPEGTEDASIISAKAGNTFLRRLMNENFIEYASYVIKERAIPDVDDGLKPVQRRILWSLFRMDDGKFHKVANVIGHTMQFHPHGDASIGDALVVVANKEYYIEKQGNFGNIMTGDPSSAARYIECRLTPLAKEVLYNNDITEFVDSYDGRNHEPVSLPSKIPSLLMLGAEGIAVGMATKIMSHNFIELINAQIAILRNKPFEIFPDFKQGGIMDVSEYNEGNGKITIRAKVDRDGRKLIIREVAASTTTESLIASIEKAVEKGKMKLASINDYTTDKVEIEIVPTRGIDPDTALKALYAYTNCSVSISTNFIVICEGMPVQMNVPDVLRRNTEKLLFYLRRELEIELNKLLEKFHSKTLAQIFIENRIYKRIEECNTEELVFIEVHKGLKKFRKMLNRDVTDEDIEKLLTIPIRRISLFDINRNKKDIAEILKLIEQVEKNLNNLKKYAINYLKDILKKYSTGLERRTEIETFDKIDRQAVALNNIVVGWDRKNCYIGTNVKSDDRLKCNEYDHLLCIERTGKYKVINIPDKAFVGRVYYFGKYDKEQVYYVIYSDKKSGKHYGKQCKMGPFITDKEYTMIPKGCKLEIITTRENSLYQFKIDTRVKEKQILELNLSDLQERSAKARGVLLDNKKILKFKFKGIIEVDTDGNDDDSDDNKGGDNSSNDENQAPNIPKPVQKKESNDKKQPSTEIASPSTEENIKEEKTAKPKKAKAKTEKKQSTSKAVKAKDDEAEENLDKSQKNKKQEEMKTQSNQSDNDWGIQQPEFGF